MAYGGPLQGFVRKTQWNRRLPTYASGNLGKSNPGLDESNGALRQVIGSAGQTAGSSIQDLMSPYTEGVLSPVLRHISEAAQGQNNNIASTSTMSGAFGDSGYGVQKALNDRNTQQNIGDATSGAYNTAFNNAQTQKNNALQQLISGASGLSGNATSQFGENQSLAQLLSAMGSTEQGANAQGVNNAMTVNNQKNSGQLNQYATLMSLLRGAPVDTTTTNQGYQTGTTTRPDNSGWALAGSLLGGGGGGGGRSGESAGLLS
jgi:hypothetical protein